MDEKRIRETVKYMTEELLGIDSIAGLYAYQRVNVCSRICKGTLHKLGINEQDNTIVDEVYHTIEHYDDYLYE